MSEHILNWGLWAMRRALTWLRSSFAWDDVGRLMLVVFGLVGTLITIIGGVVRDLPRSRELVLWSLLLVLVGAGVVALVRNRIPTWQVWRVAGGNDLLTLGIRKGDLLDAAGGSLPTVITMSRQFTLAGADVNDASLIHQLAVRSSCGSRQALARAHASVDFDSEVVRDVGVISRIEQDGRAYLLLAATSVPRSGHDATQLPMGDVWAALTAVWRWSYDHNQSVRVPVIGAGRSGSALGHELLLSLLVISLVGFVRECSPRGRTMVEVVIAAQDWKPQRIARVRALLKDLGCRPQPED